MRELYEKRDEIMAAIESMLSEKSEEMRLEGQGMGYVAELYRKDAKAMKSVVMAKVFELFEMI